MRDNGRMSDTRRRRRYDRTLIATEADPFFHCSACADQDHDHHDELYVDLFGELHACCCPTCA